ncbi:MAG: ABC transporter permease, partial [Lautropia mirabilis]|nr:ABC transporter permease [Lautropia mirabilis]
MKLLRAWLGALPGYLWSGWGAIASLLLGMALWEALAAWYG